MRTFYRQFKPNMIKQVYLVLTTHCNLSCPFCIRACHSSTAVQLNVTTIERILGDVFANFSSAEILLSGGEPTLHPDLIQIVDKAFRLFPIVTLVTNGTNPSLIEDLAIMFPSLRVQISLDGNKIIHDRLRGIGSFVLTLDSIRRLQILESRLTVASTISQDNVDCLEELYLLISQWGPIRWKVSLEMPGGEATNRTKRHLPVNEWNKLRTVLSEMVAKSGGSLISRPHFKFIGFDIDLSNATDEQLNHFGCQACLNRIYIYPDQRVFGCPMLLDFPLVDLNETSLAFLTSSKIFQSMLTIKFDRESLCYYCKYLSTCRGGCLGSAYFYSGKLTKGDPACPLVCGS
jgi:radical SAM protein with 4Fe4S-binding SPASM domain